MTHAAVIWKVVTAGTTERLAQQLTALNTAGFTVHTILPDSGAGFTVIAYSVQERIAHADR